MIRHAWHSMSMENEQVSPEKKSNITPIAITIAVVAIILVAAVGYMMTQNSDKAKEEALEQQTNTQESTAAQPTAPQTPIASYKDGTYNAEGMYTSPGGAESIDVSITLKDGVVTGANVVSNATRPISKKMQSSFIGGFKEQVVGKNIDEINITKVSASSLTPKGFKDALEKIKVEAKA